MRWLHRLTNHTYQVVVQRLYVRLVSEFGGEALKSLPSVVLPPVKTSIYKGLDKSPEGVNRAAIMRVEATIANPDCCPVSARKAS